MTDTPEIGGRQPIALDARVGETYWWCACGRSKNQPFCDGSHAGTAFTPIEWSSERERRVMLCACKRTGKAPLCDGSHAKL
jgi:CDGSH iron-sulfur domain-containing protein 3